MNTLWYWKGLHEFSCTLGKEVVYFYLHVQCNTYQDGNSFCLPITLPTMDERRRKKKRVVLVNWDDQSRGACHYVAISTLKIMPGSSLCAGGRVKMKHGGKIWTGTVAAARKKSAASRFIQGSYLRSIWSRQSTTSAIFFPTCQRIGTMLFFATGGFIKKIYFPCITHWKGNLKIWGCHWRVILIFVTLTAGRGGGRS